VILQAVKFGFSLLSALSRVGFEMNMPGSKIHVESTSDAIAREEGNSWYQAYKMQINISSYDPHGITNTGDE
jgi:hypothetical protein